MDRTNTTLARTASNTRRSALSLTLAALAVSAGTLAPASPAHAEKVSPPKSVHIADTDASGTVNVDDLFEYLNLWFAGKETADVDGDSSVTVIDLFAYIDLWLNAYFTPASVDGPRRIDPDAKPADQDVNTRS